MKEYLAFEISQTDHVFSRGLVRKQEKPLKEQHVRVSVQYSGINYKDALAATKDGGIIKEYPKIPGIDLAGEVIESNTDDFKVGDKVLATGFGLGVLENGGFSQSQQVPTDWLIKLPESFTTKEAMTFGTAGFTAALSVLALDKQRLSKEAPIYVTGATGGVGGFAILLLQQLGYQNITAISRKKEQENHLANWKNLEIKKPEEVLADKIKPLSKQTISALIDTVGGDLLSGLLPQIKQNGRVYACGNVGGNQLNTTILPFILRGIQLIGIDSVTIEQGKRKEIWQFLSENKQILTQMPCQEVLLPAIDGTISSLLKGTHFGRTIINLGVKA